MKIMVKLTLGCQGCTESSTERQQKSDDPAVRYGSAGCWSDHLRNPYRHLYQWDQVSGIINTICKIW